MSCEKNTDLSNGLPADAAKIATIRLDEKPRASSFGSKITMAAGYLTSIVTSAYSEQLVSDIAKEDVSAYTHHGKDLVSNVQNGLSRIFDLKLWKSNLAGIVTLLGGILLTNSVVRKIEEHTFTQKHGELPRMDQVNQILKGEFQPEEIAKTTWQEKTQKSEEAQQSISI